MDAIDQLKNMHKQTWAGFVPFETFTASAVPRLLKFAGIAKAPRGAAVLDVGCGTGVVAITAARAGAKVTGLDLTPELIERAKENAAIAKVEATWHEGDAEALPFPDATFDFVVSQFGHMFAPRPEVTSKEMLRVLKPGGTIAFSTWPPELFTGRMFALGGKYGPPPPPGASPPPEWGDPNIVRQRLGSAVKDLTFDRDVIRFFALSPAHYRIQIERHAGPIGRLVATLEANDPAKLAALRRDIEDLIAIYFEDNHARQDYLLTRAVKL